jgi:hypothetical protein
VHNTNYYFEASDPILVHMLQVAVPRSLKPKDAAVFVKFSGTGNWYRVASFHASVDLHRLNDVYRVHYKDYSVMAQQATHSAVKAFPIDSAIRVYPYGVHIGFFPPQPSTEEAYLKERLKLVTDNYKDALKEIENLDTLAFCEDEKPKVRLNHIRKTLRPWRYA